MIPPRLAGLGHYLLASVPCGLTVAILPTAALWAILLRAYARLGWLWSGLQLEGK